MIEKLQFIIGQMVTQIAQLQHEVEAARAELEEARSERSAD